MITMRYCLIESKITPHDINNFQENGECLSCTEKKNLYEGMYNSDWWDGIAESVAVDNAVERACHPEDVGEKY